MSDDENYSGTDHDELQHGTHTDIDYSKPAADIDHNIRYDTKMGITGKLLILDRVLFSFLILPGLFIGLAVGLIPACVFVVAIISLRLIMQFALRKRIGDIYTYMPLKLIRGSTDMMAMFSIITIGISYNEGELTGFLMAVIVIGIAYLILISICFFRYDEETN